MHVDLLRVSVPSIARCNCLQLPPVHSATPARPSSSLTLWSRRQWLLRHAPTNTSIPPPQALLANIAALYAVYHGPEGLKTIASRVNGMACILAAGAQKLGLKVRAGAVRCTVFSSPCECNSKCWSLARLSAEHALQALAKGPRRRLGSQPSSRDCGLTVSLTVVACRSTTRPSLTRSACPSRTPPPWRSWRASTR